MYYIAQNIKNPNLYLISPDTFDEEYTTDIKLAYHWKSLAACKVWCGGCGGREWRPKEI